MKPHWATLAPDTPLRPEKSDQFYGLDDPNLHVTPPGLSASHIADWIMVGGSTVLLAGPRGVGKTTALQRAAQELRGHCVTVVLPLSRFSGADALTADALLLRIAGRAAYVAIRALGLNLSVDVRDTLVRAGVLSPQFLITPSMGLSGVSPDQILAMTMQNIAELSQQGRVAILIDGLDELPTGQARELASNLARIPDDVSLVATIPWSLTYGPRRDTVCRFGEHLVSMSPYSHVEGGDAYLVSLLERRLGIAAGSLTRTSSAATSTSTDSPPPEAVTAVGLALVWSGGIPRTFLRTVGQAAMFARLRSKATWPNTLDVETAVASEIASIRRQLLPGDKAALRLADGTDGVELELDRKLRFLDQGLLFETLEGDDTVLSLHPMARAAVRAMSGGARTWAPAERDLTGSPPSWKVPESTTPTALQGFKIETYRGVSGVNLEALGRVNLLIGVNNAGKTSVLEALHILAHRSDPRGVIEAVRRRARGRNADDETWLHGQLPVPFALNAALSGNHGLANVVGVAPDSPDDPDEDRTIYLGSLRIVSGAHESEQTSVTDFRIGKRRETRLTGEAAWLVPSVLHSPFSTSDHDRMTEYHAASVESGAHDTVVQFIREHLDSELQDIDFVRDNDRFLVTHRKFGRAIDLSSFGDGIQRVYRIGLLFASARNGFALIDEFENAIHASILPAFANFIQQLAREFHVQVFLTTHSKDAIDALAMTALVDEDLVAYVLQRAEDGSVAVRRFDGMLLHRAVDAGDIDLRRL